MYSLPAYSKNSGIFSISSSIKIISTFGKSTTILDKESIDFTAALQWSHPGAKKHSKTLPLSANGKDSLNSDLT